VNIELQEDFSMDQALSLYLLDTIPLVDPQAAGLRAHPADARGIHSRRPDIILRKQLDRVKDQKMAEMKMEGIEYDQRMEELEKLEYPKPNRNSSIPPSTPLPTGIRGWARKTSVRNPSPGRCSNRSARFPITSGITNCSAPRAFCCGI
jgi:hypothetical protein